MRNTALIDNFLMLDSQSYQKIYLDSAFLLPELHRFVSLNSSHWIHLTRFISLDSSHWIHSLDSSHWIHLIGFISPDSSHWTHLTGFVVLGITKLQKRRTPQLFLMQIDYMLHTCYSFWHYCNTILNFITNQAWARNGLTIWQTRQSAY